MSKKLPKCPECNSSKSLNKAYGEELYACNKCRIIFSPDEELKAVAARLTEEHRVPHWKKATA